MILLLAWALGRAASAAESEQTAREREVRERQQALAIKQQQLLELSEELVRRLDDLAQANKTLLELDPQRRRYRPPKAAALQAVEELRVELLAETRRDAAKQIAVRAKSDVDAQRPNQGGVITLGQRVIVVPPGATADAGSGVSGKP